ncbi:glycosyltransferase family 4 protein [Modestobacter italicus]|uniref:glycosyltransferase family 4 protein n=1 Tax=Modestobacter italicus (strain DSM 44449 / CECT 9708 / BC 501) TaxID=2732864 RepID=UPI0027E1FDD6|nr:glycosyltransferase family 1 protein [Modestobacter italicus]
MTGSSAVRVLVDATAVPADRGGVGRYVDQLLPALRDQDVDVVVASQRRDVEHYRSLVPGALVLPAPAAVARRPVRLLWEQVGLPVLAARAGVQVLHSPHYTMPLVASVPVVTTLHDATFFTQPEVHLRSKRVFFRAWTRVSLRRARRCVVPSQATADELARATGAVDGRVDVAHHGVDPVSFHVPTDAERAAARAHLGLRARRYVAFLGTIEPRKNVPTLIAAWVAACAELTDPPALVVAGGRGWDTDLDAALAAVPPHLEVLLPGYLPLDLLAGFLGGAEVVAYPSLGEGFGLPVLEAMASGAAVLTTPVLALPEVGGDAVAYAASDAGALAVALGALLADAPRRAELAAAAVARAATFTWSECARVHAETYRCVAGRPQPRR